MELTCEGRAGIAAGQTVLSAGGSLEEGRDAHTGPRGVEGASSRSLLSISWSQFGVDAFRL